MGKPLWFIIFAKTGAIIYRKESSIPEDKSAAKEKEETESSAESKSFEVVNLSPGDANKSAAEAAIKVLDAASPKLYLREYETTVALNDSFGALSYIDTIEDDKDDYNTISRRIHVDGTVDVKRRGDYELTFYVVDTDGNHSNDALLTVHVE